MMPINITPEILLGGNNPWVVIAGPCVIEDENLCFLIAEKMVSLCRSLNIPYVFKASFDKANRTSIHAFRGIGMDRGLSVLQDIKKEFGIPILTDVHETNQLDRVADVADILQIPAFLCRQTDLLVGAGKTGRTVNLKKGQFMAPEDMQPAIEKVKSTGNEKVFVTERGCSFGYHNLVVDMRSLVIMRSLQVPVVFDATHSVQLPGGKGNSSGGQKEFIPPLLRAAAAVGVDGIFLETHPHPDKAKSDGANSIPLEDIFSILHQGVKIHDLVRKSITN